jgi:inorganic pyrophosphatase
MKKSIIIIQFIVILTGLALATQKKDPYQLSGFTLKAGNYASSVCDTLTGPKDLYHAYRAKNSDGTVNAVIEIPAGTNDKWETDTATGRLYWELQNGAPRVVKFLGYPGNYGMIPRTKGGDSDPLDIVVLGGMKQRGTVIAVKPVGVLFLEDKGLIDDKIIAVEPGSFMGNLNNISELDGLFPGMLIAIKAWFGNYKGLNGGLVVKGFGGFDTAMTIINAAIKNTDTTTVALTPPQWVDDSVTAEGFTRIYGKYGQTLGGVLGSADSLSNGKNMYVDNPSRNAEKLINAVIEIPCGTICKWETDIKKGGFFWENQLGMKRVVRFLGYPGDYGMIPRTTGGDGDPLDIIVFGTPILRGEIVPVKVIGVMYLLDAGLIDDKILAVVPGKNMGEINNISDLNDNYPGSVDYIRTWLTSYKGIGGGLEARGFGDVDTAMQIVYRAIRDFGDPVKKPAALAQRYKSFTVTQLNSRGNCLSIAFSVANAGRVKMGLYSLSGELMATIIDKDFSAGNHSIFWSGHPLQAGCHIVKMQAGAQKQTMTINLFK